MMVIENIWRSFGKENIDDQLVLRSGNKINWIYINQNPRL